MDYLIKEYIEFKNFLMERNNNGNIVTKAIKSMYYGN